LTGRIVKSPNWIILMQSKKCPACRMERTLHYSCCSDATNTMSYS